MITARDLARLLELNKKKAEIEFRAAVLGASPDRELKDIAAGADDLAARAKAAGAELAIPGKQKLDEYARALGEFQPDAIRESLKIRDGRPYQTLKERGAIVKKNFENRLEIAKLSILISRMSDDEGRALHAAVSSGSLGEELGIRSLGEKERQRLCRFLRRCGIPCVVSGELLVPSEENKDEEAGMEMANRRVWINKEDKARLEDNIRKINEINARIQLKNAERQIKVFDDDEESGFASLQREYLELLKQQDEILREFNDEEKLAAGS